MSKYAIPVFADAQPTPPVLAKGKGWAGGVRRVSITDDQVRDMRSMYEVGMLTASQVHAAYPQFSLQHVTRILDRKSRRDVK